MDPLRLLTFSSLYPSESLPGHGLFVEKRLRQLVQTGLAESRVVAPVPWFPSANPMFGEYAAYARTPPREIRHDIRIEHPRYLRAPKIGMSAAPLAMARAALPAIRRIESDGYRFDAIDAHYFFPDGVAAAMLAARLDRPLVITARGTDINLVPRYRLPRAMIRWAASRADGLVAVCGALRNAMVDLGIPAERIAVLRNGVDLEFFRPFDRRLARKRLGIGDDTPVLVSAGLLIRRKGHDIPVRALPQLPDVRLFIAGDGPERKALQELAVNLGVSERVTFTGRVPQEELRWYFSAANALVLASSREGWANVLLEAMACGTPVIASDVWGTPEVVCHPDAGVLMSERTPAALVDAYRRLNATAPSREATRRHAEKFSWEETTSAQLRLFRGLVSRDLKAA